MQITLNVHPTRKKSGREIATPAVLTDINRLTVMVAPKGILLNLNKYALNQIDELPIEPFEVPIIYNYATNKVRIGEPWRSKLSAAASRLNVDIVRKIERQKFTLSDELQQAYLKTAIPEATETPSHPLEKRL